MHWEGDSKDKLYLILNFRQCGGLCLLKQIVLITLYPSWQSSLTMLKVTLRISSLRRIEVITIKLKRTLIIARLMSVTTIRAPEVTNIFVDAEEKIFEYLPLFMWDHSLTSRVILRKVSSVLFVSIFLQTNIIFIQILLGQSGDIYKHKQPIKNHTSTDISRKTLYF